MATPSALFGRSLAVVVGINAYSAGIAPLRSAVPDAAAVAQALQRDHGFETWCFLDGEAQRSQLLALLLEKLPNVLGANDRLLFYFAGHGIALDSDAGPAGSLLPADAQRSDRDSFLPMRVVHDALRRLPVRHAFVILDCCFAGTFRWAHSRDVDTVGDDSAKIYRERYARYIESPAWQVLTSASSDQRALDVLANDRDEGAGDHSPFALALLAGLAGAADYTKDNVITADELALYVRERVVPAAERAGARQVPQLFALEHHEGGQFVFQVPGRALELAPAPRLDENANPYRGLEPFQEGHRAMFFGRAELSRQLVHAVHARQLTVALGPSGSGKSSLVQAGLRPVLRSQGWEVLPTQRPGRKPLAVLDAWTAALGGTSVPGDSVASWVTAVTEHARVRPDDPWLVIVDQFEELLTHRTTELDRSAFLGALASALHVAPNLHVVVTVRSDAEPQFHRTALAPWWTEGRFLMRAMTRDELRQAIEQPAVAAVLHFEPSRLVEQLLDDVALVPAPLPLLSFALGELYRCCWLRWQRGVRDRALHETDYLDMGSVAGALSQRADAVHDQLVAEDPAYATTIRNVFTRMVAVVGGEVARRRVPRSELMYETPAENQRVVEVLQRFHDARLISLGRDERSDLSAAAYAEPTHDELVRGWTKVSQWLDELDASIGTRALASLGEAARSWKDHGQLDSHLWNTPRVEQMNELARAHPLIFNADEARFVERGAHLRRRQRARVIGGLASAAVVLAVIAAAALWQRNQATQNERTATERLAVSDMEQGRALLLDGHSMKALPYLVAARTEGIESSVLRMLFARASDALPQLTIEHPDRHGERLTAAAFSPDGTSVVTATTNGAMVWDARTGKPILRGQLKAVTAASFSPDGARLVTACEIDRNAACVFDTRTGKYVTQTGEVDPLKRGGGEVINAEFTVDGARLVTFSGDTVRVWDASTGKPLTGPLECGRDSSPTVFSPDGARLLTTNFDNTRVWDASTGKPLTGLLERRSVVTSAAFSPDGARLVIVSGDYKANHIAQVWDARTGEPLTEPLEHRDQVTSAAFSPDGAHLLTTSYGNAARVWDARTGKLLTEFPEHLGAVTAAEFSPEDVVTTAAFSPDGARIVTVSLDYTARVWDARTGKPLTPPLEHRNEITAAAFSPDSARVVTASRDDTARVWDARTGKPLTDPLEHRLEVTAAAFSPDGARLITASGDNIARIWDAPPGKPLTPPLEHRNEITAAAFSPDGARIVTASADHTARVWDARTGKPLTDPIEHRDTVTAAAFSPDGTRLVTASINTARVWDARTGKPLTDPIEHHERGTVIVAAFSPDGTRLVTAGSDSTARVWDARTGKPLTPFLQHRLEVKAAAFSPDGARLVTASYDFTARVWDARTGKLLTNPLEHRGDFTELLTHRGPVAAAAFSPDGARVVTASLDHTARVWDARTGKPVTDPLEHHDPVYAAAFSPDGARVVTACADGAARVWDAHTGKPLTEEPLEHRGAVGEPLEHRDGVVGPLEYRVVAFSQDGARLVTASYNNTARVWDVPMDLDTGSLSDWQRRTRCAPFALENSVLVKNRNSCP